jgi:hypothetical protein
MCCTVARTRGQLIACPIAQKHTKFLNAWTQHRERHEEGTRLTYSDGVAGMQRHRNGRGLTGREREAAVRCSGVLFASGRLHSYIHRGRSRTGRLAPGCTEADPPPSPHDAAPHGAVALSPAQPQHVEYFPMLVETFACIRRPQLALGRLLVTGSRNNSQNRV